MIILTSPGIDLVLRGRQILAPEGGLPQTASNQLPAPAPVRVAAGIAVGGGSPGFHQRLPGSPKVQAFRRFHRDGRGSAQTSTPRRPACIRTAQVGITGDCPTCFDWTGIRPILGLVPAEDPASCFMLGSGARLASFLRSPDRLGTPRLCDGLNDAEASPGLSGIKTSRVLA